MQVLYWHGGFQKSCFLFAGDNASHFCRVSKVDIPKYCTNRYRLGSTLGGSTSKLCLPQILKVIVVRLL